MNLREAAQAALDALEVATTPLAKDRQEVIRARELLRAALAQPEAEPVLWRYTNKVTQEQVTTSQPPDRVVDLEKYEVLPLYTAPHRREPVPVPVPVAWAEDAMLRVLAETGFCHAELTTAKRPRKSPLYASPQRRKPLTEQEIEGAIYEGLRTVGLGMSRQMVYRAIARAVERKHEIGGDE